MARIKVYNREVPEIAEVISAEIQRRIDLLWENNRLYSGNIRRDYYGIDLDRPQMPPGYSPDRMGWFYLSEFVARAGTTYDDFANGYSRSARH